MRRLFLYFIIWILPIQPLFAADADFAHLLEKRSVDEKQLTHLIQHLNHMESRDDHQCWLNSENPILHLVDFDHGLNFSILPATTFDVVLIKPSLVLPMFHSTGYLNPDAIPPTKPPYWQA